jgi:hypothetical protein
MEKMQAENVAELMSMVLFFKEPVTDSQEENTN